MGVLLGVLVEGVLVDGDDLTVDRLGPAAGCSGVAAVWVLAAGFLKSSHSLANNEGSLLRMPRSFSSIIRISRAISSSFSASRGSAGSASFSAAFFFTDVLFLDVFFEVEDLAALFLAAVEDVACAFVDEASSAARATASARAWA